MAGVRQLPGQASADDAHAVQAQDRVHRAVVPEPGHQLPGNVPGLGELGFLLGDVDVVIDVAVVGGEMPPGYPQGDVSMGHGQSFDLKH